MNSKYFAISILAVILAAGGGFFVANAINRSEMDGMRAEIDSLKRSLDEARKASEETTLSDDEIRARISEADANPSNVKFNLDLGLGLYRYAAMKRDVELLKESIRLLERVKAESKSDYDVLVGLGNAHFDIGTFADENERFPTARSIYLEAAKLRPNDANVRTDIALTYFLEKPPQIGEAVKEFEIALKDDPRNERALQFLAQTYWQAGKLAESSATVDRLRSVNPANPAIPDLETMLTRPSTQQ